MWSYLADCHRLAVKKVYGLFTGAHFTGGLFAGDLSLDDYSPGGLFTGRNILR